MMKVEKRVQILLSTQRALLGAISGRVRAVGCFWDDCNIEICFVFEKLPLEDELEDVSCVETEIMCDFPEYKVRAIHDVVEMPNKISLKSGSVLVYMRKE